MMPAMPPGEQFKPIAPLGGTTEERRTPGKEAAAAPATNMRRSKAILPTRASRLDLT